MQTLLEWIRLCVRLPLFILWSMFIWLLRLLVWPSSLVAPSFDRRVRRGITSLWAKVIFPLVGMRVVIKGKPPAPPFYMVANHLSYVDTWLINGLVGAAFVARGDVANWPILGLLIRSMNVLFVDRANKRDAARVNQLIAHVLDEGDGFIIFPESRISRGLDVEPFKSALIEPAVAIGMPVHYATITYRSCDGCPPANQLVGWWRPEPFMAHLLRLLRHRGFTAYVTFGEAPLHATDRKALARALTQAVRAQFTPMD